MVTASNAAETTTKHFVVLSTVFLVLGFAVSSGVEVGVKDGVEDGVKVAVQLPVPASAIPPPLPIVHHLQAPVVLEELAEPHERHPRVAHLQHTRT